MQCYHFHNSILNIKNYNNNKNKNIHILNTLPTLAELLSRSLKMLVRGEAYRVSRGATYAHMSKSNMAALSSFSSLVQQPASEFTNTNSSSLDQACTSLPKNS